MKKHSLFFWNVGDATSAQQVVESGTTTTNCSLCNDGESRNIEVRFYTEQELAASAQKRLVRATGALAPQFNADEKE